MFKFLKKKNLKNVQKYFNAGQMEELQKLPEVWKRVEAVRQTRLASVSAPTRKLAEKPTHFHVENMPKSNYLVIPEVSSERRRYIPRFKLDDCGWVESTLSCVENATQSPIVDITRSWGRTPRTTTRSCGELCPVPEATYRGAKQRSHAPLRATRRA